VIKAMKVVLVVGSDEVGDWVKGVAPVRKDHTVVVVEGFLDGSVVCRRSQVRDFQEVELTCVRLRIACTMSAASTVTVYAATTAVGIDMLGDEAVVCLEIVLADDVTHGVFRDTAVFLVVQDRYERKRVDGTMMEMYQSDKKNERSDDGG